MSRMASPTRLIAERLCISVKTVEAHKAHMILPPRMMVPATFQVCNDPVGGPTHVNA